MSRATALRLRPRATMALGLLALVTVAVEPEDAEKLTYGILNGTLWLTLLAEDDLPAVTTPGRTIENIFD